MRYSPGHATCTNSLNSSSDGVVGKGTSHLLVSQVTRTDAMTDRIGWVAVSMCGERW